MKRNLHLSRLKDNYLFPEIHQRKQAFLAKHPAADLISLGVGDTTLPLPECVAKALATYSAKLATPTGYTGYGLEKGCLALRNKISAVIYQNQMTADEIFVSDGAKCDLGRLQMLFGGDLSIAVQDPTYPVYLEGSLMQGVQNIIKLPCGPDNDFFPDLEHLPQVDLIYFCSPNNPTGAVATKEQLERLVAFATANRSIIIFDAAYANFIQDESLPKSIYEIKDAEKVAIEIGSFSKLAGFTGVRLSWCVVPKELCYDDGSSINADWNRVTTTIFNGASNIAQAGGLAVLKEEGLKQIKQQTNYYLENAKIIRLALEELGYEVFGGTNAPYLWVKFPSMRSWDIFQHLLENFHLVTTPGSGFGSYGEGFIRLTAFGAREKILEAMARLNKVLAN